MKRTVSRRGDGLNNVLSLRFGLPWVVSANIPKVAFEVAAGKGTTAVVHVRNIGNDGCAGGFGRYADGVRVGDDKVGALGLTQIDLVGLNDLPSVFAAVIDGAEHDHPSAQGELGMGDGVVRSHVNSIFLEAEGTAQPVDGGRGIAVAEARNEGGFIWIVHGCKDAIVGGGVVVKMPKYRLLLGCILPCRGWRHGRL